MYKSGSTLLCEAWGQFLHSLSLSVPSSKMDKSTRIRWPLWAFREVICHILTQPLTPTTGTALTMITRKRQAPQASPSEGSALGCLSLRGIPSHPSVTLTAFKGPSHLGHWSWTAGCKVWPDHTLEAELTASSFPHPRDLGFPGSKMRRTVFSSQGTFGVLVPTLDMGLA